jgi:transposase
MKKREQFLEELKTIDPANIVYSDEAGMDDNEASMTGWAPRGERCYAQKKAERGARYNMAASLNCGKLFAPFVFEGYFNRKVYELYIEQILVPKLRPGMVFVIDNAQFHKSKKITSLIEATGSRAIFLPSYSPDLNPIEHYWFVVKNAIRSAVNDSENFYDTVVRKFGELCTA